MSKNRRIFSLAKLWQVPKAGKSVMKTLEGTEKLSGGHLNSIPEGKGQACRAKSSWMRISQLGFFGGGTT